MYFQPYPGNHLLTPCPSRARYGCNSGHDEADYGLAIVQIPEVSFERTQIVRDGSFR